MNLRPLALCVVIAACKGVPLAPADASPSVVYEDPRIDGDALSDELLAQMTRTRVPGLSACVVEAGDIVWCVAHGWADLENERPVLVETPFLLASVSKLVTATLVMQRRDQGDFSLDEAIDGGMPFSAKPHPPKSRSPLHIRGHPLDESPLCTQSHPASPTPDLNPSL